VKLLRSGLRMLSVKPVREISVRSQRMRGRRLMEENAALLAAEPLCAICKRAAALEVDHIIPLQRGGADDLSNKQGLCIPCHRAKTAREAKDRGY
jgi:5-methylcytosine-specific restriction protein A